MTKLTLSTVMRSVAAIALAGGLALAGDIRPAQAGSATERPIQPAKLSKAIQGRETYLRLALGADFKSLEDGYWQGADAGVPVVYFDLDSDKAAYAAAAFGVTFKPGLRGEVALNLFGEKDVTGTWTHTVPVVAGPHADVNTSLRSTALMANVVYAPLEAQGNTNRFQPFVTAGLGLAMNKMDTWTRTNLALVAPNRPVRSFEGNTNTDLALMVGFGGSFQVNRSKAKPIHLELMYQYFDLGQAKGSATPLPANGNSSPQIPLTIDNNAHVISFGVRIPLN